MKKPRHHSAVSYTHLLSVLVTVLTRRQALQLRNFLRGSFSRRKLRSCRA